MFLLLSRLLNHKKKYEYKYKNYVLKSFIKNKNSSLHIFKSFIEV